MTVSYNILSHNMLHYIMCGEEEEGDQTLYACVCISLSLYIYIYV